MKRDYLLLAIGIWTMTLSELGFPPSWKRVLFVLTGLAIVGIAYSFWHDRMAVRARTAEPDTA